MVARYDDDLVWATPSAAHYTGTRWDFDRTSGEQTPGTGPGQPLLIEMEEGGEERRQAIGERNVKADSRCVELGVAPG